MTIGENHDTRNEGAGLHSVKPVRAVLDTNILVAFALLDETPAPRRHDALRRCVERVRADRGLLGSTATLAELRAVLMRPGFERYSPAAARQRFVDAITAETTLVVPAPIGRLCRDPEDDMFLAAALAGDADWLVTVDRQLLSVRSIGRTPIRRPERFLEAVA
ncbi:putative toxin-antitoxin system toxin component, PIN family [Azospirillum agricola]|uniref:putative toxin-antitoxin system toxin component, PIN family n=1 Tax=Azospirillum agricola TaxID=1720247 RepID=UPI000A0F327C|nr:putative toxin-antitoxin system toxin component, PIN family [Azospirillum agricola]SMH58251.1 putative toxin-antitoxin system toxin component, PIN family [Azospirillum lipoferum]